MCILNRPAEPEVLLLPDIKRQPAQPDGSIEPLAAGDVASRDVAAGRDSGEGVVAPLPARQSRQHAALAAHRAQRVIQISLQHRVRADLHKDAKTGGHQRGHPVREADRAADVAPPILPIKLARLNLIARDRGYQLQWEQYKL